MNAKRYLAILMSAVVAHFLFAPKVTDAACLISEAAPCATVEYCEDLCEYGNRCGTWDVIGYVFPGGYSKCRPVAGVESGHEGPCTNSVEPVNCYQWYNCTKYLQCSNPLADCGDECPHTSSYWQCGFASLGNVHTRYSEVEDYTKPSCP